MSQLGISPVSSGGKQRQSPCSLPQAGSWLISSHCMCVLEGVPKRLTRVSVVPLVKIADKHKKKPKIPAGFI